MIKGSELLGKPIVAFADGAIVEKVHDLIYDSQSHTLLALLIDEGGFLSSARVIGFDKIKAIGPDAITIDSESVIMKAEADQRIDGVIKEQLSVKGLQVMTEDGQDLGKITDLFFNESTGKVEGYEVSGGMFADAYNGRSFLPAPKTLKIGEDVAFVPNDTVQLMESQVGGLKEVGQNMANVAREKGQTLKDQAQTKAQELSDKARSQAEKTQTSLSRKVQEGQSKVRSEWEANSPSAKQELAEFWETVKSTASQMTDRAGAAIEDQRIKGAVGRPVSRVIFDAADQVILNAGDLITNQAIERARAAGVLDVLLNSVYTEKPQLSKDDLRAGVR